jgi:hypothetical protein
VHSEKIEFKYTSPNYSILNALRTTLYKEDYNYYLDCELPDIVLETEDNVYIQRDYIRHRLNSIPIKVYPEFEAEYEKAVEAKIPIATLTQKKAFEAQHMDIFSKDIQLSREFSTAVSHKKLFNNFRICQIPFSDTVFQIKDIVLKKGLGSVDARFSNVHSFSFKPTDSIAKPSENIIGKESSSYAVYQMYAVLLEVCGQLSPLEVLRRGCASLVKKLERTKLALKPPTINTDDATDATATTDANIYIYNADDAYHVFYNEDYILENIILYYAYETDCIGKSENPICHVNTNNNYKINLLVRFISADNLLKIFSMAQADIVKLEKQFATAEKHAVSTAVSTA